MLTKGIFGGSREYLSDVMRETKTLLVSLFDLKGFNFRPSVSNRRGVSLSKT
jgi:hypothetical protein